MKYSVFLNLGNEYIGANEKTITVNEVVETADEQALAREIAHENPLIPEQVAAAVLQNFCKAAANLMSMGFAIQLKNGKDVAMRIYPDIHVKGGNINLTRAKELDPSVTELTLENAGELVSKAGVTVRAKAECEQKFTDLLLSIGASVQRKDVVEKAKVARANGEGSSETPSGGSETGGGTNQGGGSQGGGTGTIDTGGGGTGGNGGSTDPDDGDEG
ncbi:MAG: hypothetical protein K6G70_07865 [Bacteroidaceae bacterium]|nr:hypothetical protein [Bacteroidaceae bacterium]